MRMIGSFVDTYMKLWYARKPTIAAVQGWCVGGGTDMVLCADLIVAAEGATFGYPPARVWGTPTTAMWVYRMGLEQADAHGYTQFDDVPGRPAAPHSPRASGQSGRCCRHLPATGTDQGGCTLRTSLNHISRRAKRAIETPTGCLLLKLVCRKLIRNC